MMPDGTAAAGRKSGFMGVWALLAVVLCWGHYGLTPVTDFVADDWYYLGDGIHRTVGEIAASTVRDYYRPVNILVNRLIFLHPGDSPVFFSVARVAMHGVILALFLGLLNLLFRDRRALWIGGAFYVLNPNTHEMFHWANMVAILYFPAAILLSVVCWLLWCRGRGWGYLLLSAAGYLLGVLTYENCVPFCLVYPLAARLFAPGRRLRGAWIHLALAGLYVAYRFTHGFGWGLAAVHGGSYFGEGEGLDLIGTVQNVRTVFSWWIGGLAAQSFLGGFLAFARLVPKVQFLFVAISLGGLGWVWRRVGREGPGPAESRAEEAALGIKGVLLGLAWMLLAYLPHLLLPAASRHNILPSFGGGLLLAGVWLRWRPRVSGGALFGLALLCLIANAGNGLAWRDAGTFCRRLYRHLERTQPEWSAKALVVFDTAALRDRQTPGILDPRQDSLQTWALHQNAILLRGFVGVGMLKLCMENPPPGIQDTENGVRRQGDRLEWHERYNPSKTYQTPMEQVFWVDCLAVVTGAAP